MHGLTHSSSITRRSRPDVFLGKGVLKIWSNFIEEHPWRSVIAIKLLCNFIEIALRHGRSRVNLCIFLEHLFLRTSLDGCFWITHRQYFKNTCFRNIFEVVLIIKMKYIYIYIYIFKFKATKVRNVCRLNEN